MYAKLVELIYACERADQLINNPALRGDNRVPVTFTGGRGVAHIEAPRGTLIHDYEIDEKGIVRAANMIVATQQNTAAINKSIKAGANALFQGTEDERMLNGLEFVVRCYDPCLACSTHAIGKMALAVEISRKRQDNENNMEGLKMLEMTINEKACRGCQLCLDVCPTECFAYDEETKKVAVAVVENCIGCLSCAYICPSGAISHRNHHVVKNFYRNIEFSRRMEKFL